MVLGHLAHDEVVFVVARYGGHDRCPVRAGLGQVLAFAAVPVRTIEPSSSTIWLRPRCPSRGSAAARRRTPAALRQGIADFPAADDENEDGQTSRVATGRRALGAGRRTELRRRPWRVVARHGRGDRRPGAASRAGPMAAGRERVDAQPSAGPAERREPEFGVRLGSDRVVDLGDERSTPSASDASWAAMTLRLSPSVRARKSRRLGACAAKDVLIGAVAADRLATERRRQAIEREVTMSTRSTWWPAASKASATDRADAATSDDHCLHLVSSGIGSRTTHTAQGAFWRMYGMVLPMANSPPKRLRYGRPRTSRSAPRSLASSTTPHRRHGPGAGPARAGTSAASATSSAMSRTRWTSSIGRRRRHRGGSVQSISTTWTAMISDLCGRGQLGDEPDDPCVARSAIEGDHGALEDRLVGFGHRWSRYHRAVRTLDVPRGRPDGPPGGPAGDPRRLGGRSAWGTSGPSTATSPARSPPSAVSNSAGSSRR